MDPGSWGSGLTAAKVPNHNHTHKNHQTSWSMTPITSCWPRWIPWCVGMLSGTKSGRSVACTTLGRNNSKRDGGGSVQPQLPCRSTCCCWIIARI
jgi:hypothetical protein